MTKHRNTIVVITLTQLISYGLPLITFPLLVRSFNIDTYGNWIEANTLVQFMIVFGAHGLGNTLGALIVSKPEQESVFYSHMLYLYSALCVILMIITFLGAPFLNSITMDVSEGSSLLRIVSVAIPIGAFNWLASQVFRLRQQVSVGATFDVLLALSRLASVLYAFFDHDILRFALFHVISQGIITLLQIWTAYKGIPFQRLSKGVVQDLLKTSLNISTISQSNWLVMFGDRLLLSILSVSSAVAIYSASYQICLILVALGWPFLYTLLPAIGERWKTQDLIGIQVLIRHTTRTMFIVFTPSVIGLGLVGDALLRLLATDEFAQGGVLVAMIAGGIALDNIGISLQYLFFVQDRSHILRPIYLSAAGLNLIVNLVAIPLFSYYGAGVTTFLTFAYILGRLHRATQIPLTTLFDLKVFGQCFLISIIMGFWVALTVSPSILGLMVSIGGGAVIYGGGVIMLGILKIQDIRNLLPWH